MLNMLPVKVIKENVNIRKFIRMLIRNLYIKWGAKLIIIIITFINIYYINFNYLKKNWTKNKKMIADLL